MLCCHFVPLSEILVDRLLVVVQVLRLCAPFRQSGFASFTDFFSSLALLPVMLSLFSVFYCSKVRLKHLPTPLLGLRDHLFAVGARAPQHHSLQRGLMFVRSGFTPSGLWDSLPLRFVGGLNTTVVVLCHGVILWFVQHRWVVIDPRASLCRLTSLTDIFAFICSAFRTQLHELLLSLSHTACLHVF